MKTVIVAYQYGKDNAGDFAINIGTMDILENMCDKIVCISKLHVKEQKYFECKKYLEQYYRNIEIIGSPFDLQRTTFIKTLKSYIVGLNNFILYFFSPKYNIKFKNADLVILNGGNLIRCQSITDFIRLLALLFPIYLACRNDVKYIFFPQSTTFINKAGRCLLKKVIADAEILFSREELSEQKFLEWFPESNICGTIDTAFFIKDRHCVKDIYLHKYETYSKRNNNVCITIRKEKLGDIDELSIGEKNKIICKLGDLLFDLNKQNYFISIIIQTEKDKVFTEMFYREYCHENVEIIEEYDPLILREIYRNAKCLFGMRLHSLILAMSVGTPVVGYFNKEWGLKNPGTLSKCNMPFTFIDCEGDLFSLMKIAESNRDVMVSEISNLKVAFLEKLGEEFE